MAKGDGAVAAFGAFIIALWLAGVVATIWIVVLVIKFLTQVTA